MKKVIIFFSTDNVKSWASVIDKASKLRATGNFRILVTLLSRSRLLAQIFVFRNHSPTTIANQNNLSLRILAFPIAMKASSFLLSLLLTLRIKLSNWIVKPFTDSKFLAICDDYWAAKMGSKSQNPALSSFRFVFSPIYLSLPNSKFLLSKEGATALSQQEEGIFLRLKRPRTGWSFYIEYVARLWTHFSNSWAGHNSRFLWDVVGVSALSRWVVA